VIVTGFTLKKIACSVSTIAAITWTSDAATQGPPSAAAGSATPLAPLPPAAAAAPGPAPAPVYPQTAGPYPPGYGPAPLGPAPVAPGYGPPTAVAPGYGPYAQLPPPPYIYGPPPPPPPPPEPPSEGDGPAARQGFQMAVRVGASVPTGKRSGSDGDAMSDYFGPVAAVAPEFGGKLTKNICLGGSLGAGVGPAAGKALDACRSAGLSCTTFSFRLVGEVQYHFIPDGIWNPWIGYGVGVEQSTLSVSQNSSTSSYGGDISSTGFEYAHLMAGVDYRHSKSFGMGPFVDFSLGQYESVSYDLPGRSSSQQAMSSKALHEWITFGLRFVIKP
jgi:hypothetical protein